MSREPAPVLGDPVLLERLVHNLLENAQRHNFRDSWLTVSTGRTGDRATLTVTNSGPLVAPYDVGVIFEPFRRLGSERIGGERIGGERAGADRGAGLGLSIVRAVARAHGGDATATLRESGGLIVTVSLPVDPVAE